MAVVVVGAAALVLAGCAGSEPGTVTGVVHVYGGPSSPATGHPLNTGQPAPGQDVAVVDAKGTRTLATSDATGTYRLSLPPGDYTLWCGHITRFTIRSGQTTTLDCDLTVA